VLAAMLVEEEANARNEYIRALVRIGPSKEAITGLAKAAAKGSWDARQPAIIGLSMLGDDADTATFAKLAKDEGATFAAECKEDPEFEDCKKADESTKKHVEAINNNLKRIDAAKACKSDVGCWAKKLDDTNEGVASARRSSWGAGTTPRRSASSPSGYRRRTSIPGWRSFRRPTGSFMTTRTPRRRRRRSSPRSRSRSPRSAGRPSS